MNQARQCNHVPANPRAIVTPCELCFEWIASDPGTGLYRAVGPWINTLAAGDVADLIVQDLVETFVGQADRLLSKVLPDETNRVIALVALAERCITKATSSLRIERVRSSLQDYRRGEKI